MVKELLITAVQIRAIVYPSMKHNILALAVFWRAGSRALYLNKWQPLV